jgi:hypothetical protein
MKRNIYKNINIIFLVAFISLSAYGLMYDFTLMSFIGGAGAMYWIMELNNQ